MNIAEYFRISNSSTLQCIEFKVTLKVLNSVKYLEEGFDNVENYTLVSYFCLNQEEVDKLKTNYVDKHKLISIYETQHIDNPYRWMEGIVLRTDMPDKELEEIASYGSKEAYEASLPEYQDNFLLDLDYRMSMIELGIK